MRRRDAGITLVEVTAALTLVAVVVALIIPAVSRGSRIEKVIACQGHLRTMFQAQLQAPVHGPNQLGSAYWTRLAEAKPPLLAPEVLHCPVVEKSAPCDYLGPSFDPATLKDKDQLGCDSGFNHSDDGKQGGNVLLKSGEVLTDHTAIWAGAARQGKCRP
jgi:hypothetical protein